MNEDTPRQGTAPGSGAGDAAPTQQVPHIAKPAKKSVAKGTPATESPAGPTPVTDKGRARDTPASKDGQDSVAGADEGTTATATSGEVEAGKPLTAAEFVRTTKPSPATTAVIPAVKSGLDDRLAPAESDPSGRQANLRLNHIEPWSVTRIAFAISVAMMIVGVVAVTIFWIVLSITGVWTQVNDSITSVLSDNSSSFDITDYLGFWRLVGLTLVLSAINVILTTALATIAAHLYNLSAQLLGGVEVTFSEDG